MINYPDPDQEIFFRYSSGRWIWNEEDQLAARYVKFDIQALCSIAADSLGSSACSTITKLPEGNFNKTFLLSMTNGKEAVAKVPNPNSGRPGFSTANEVATMDYVSASRNSLPNSVLVLRRYRSEIIWGYPLRKFTHGVHKQIKRL